EVPPFEALSPAREAVAARLEGFYHLVHTPAPIVVTSAEAWIERCLPRATFAGAVTYVVAGEPLTPDGLAAGLVEWGYHRVPLVLPGTEQLLPYLCEEPGTLADYLPAGTLLWMQGAGAVEAAVETAWVQIEAHAAEAVREARFHPPPERLYLRAAAWRALLGGRPRVEVEGLEVLDGDALQATTYATEGLALRTAPCAEGPLRAVAARL